MKLLTKAIINKMPLPNDVEDENNPSIIVKFFGGGSYTFYVIAAYALIDGEEVKLSNINNREYDDIYFYGYVTGLQVDEWGYATLNQLKEIKFPPFGLGVERDMYFENSTINKIKNN